MGPAEPGRVLTIGYEGKTLEELLDTLVDHDVARVLDVRAVAESSVAGFSEDELAQALAAEGMDYAHLGELGDFQPQPYPDYMQGEDWQAGYERLIDHLGEQPSALLCACADVSSCHRRYLARQLREDEIPVVHLTPAGPKEAVTFESGP